MRAICVASSCLDAGARAFTAAGGRFVSGDLDLSTLEEECANADLIVDGIVGIGARGALRDAAAHAVERANSSGAVRVAVDLPSGVDADTGDVDGVAFDADVTATPGCLKPGLFLRRYPQARDSFGEPPQAGDSFGGVPSSKGFCWGGL